MLEPNGIGDRYLTTLPLMNQHAASVFRNSLSVSLTVPRMRKLELSHVSSVIEGKGQSDVRACG